LGDINFARREIRVRGKGNRDRIVPTTQKCIEAIRTYLGWRDDYRKRLSDIDIDDRGWFQQAVFVKNDGQRITRRSVSDMLTSLSCRAGIKHTTAHTLRRSCATSLMNRGMDLELIQDLLGHQDITTTQSYLVVSQDKLRDIYSKCHPFEKRLNLKQTT
jgi:site-specific recombinase XerD